jgi:hypothetical protein
MVDANGVQTPWDNAVPPETENKSAKLDFVAARQVRVGVGGLMWLGQNTRPDICEALRCVSRQMESPTLLTKARLKRILRYVAGTSRYGIFYKRKSPASRNWFLIYGDASGPNDRDRRSVTGYKAVFFGAPVNWFAKTQKAVQLDVCGAEYVASSACAREGMWFYPLPICKVG